MTSKMFLDIVGVITRSKVSILSTFQEGAPGAPPTMSSRVKNRMRVSFKNVFTYYDL